MANNQYVNKVVYDGNTLIDLTSDTVTADDVLNNKTFHLKSGEMLVGTASPGGFETDLLWTNASPSSSFAAQTISIDLSNYSWILIAHKAAASGSNLSVDIFLVGTQGHLRIVNSAIARRVASVSNTGVEFNAGYNLTQGGSSYNTNNGVCVPYQIYGIR